MGYAGQYIFVAPELNLVTVFSGNLQGDKTANPLDWFRSIIVEALG